ncbi:hypothetical protein ACWGQT_02350 [Streptomyces yangpuensis]
MTVIATSSKYDDHYYVFDAATGDEEEDRGIRDYETGVYVLHHKGLFITVRWSPGAPRLGLRTLVTAAIPAAGAACVA